MSKLRKNISDKEWSHCCGSFCGGCHIAEKYREKYGKKKGRKKFNKDRDKLGLPVKD